MWHNLEDGGATPTSHLAQDPSGAPRFKDASGGESESDRQFIECGTAAKTPDPHERLTQRAPQCTKNLPKVKLGYSLIPKGQTQRFIMNILKVLLNYIFGSRNDDSEEVKRLAVRATSLSELERMLQDWERRAVRPL